MAIPYPDIPTAAVTVPALHVGSLAVGPLPIRWYALAYIAGILLGWRYAVSLTRDPRLWDRRGPPLDARGVDDLILWITLGVIAGGRLGYILFYMLTVPASRAALAADPLEALRLWHGGMSFHGGAIGVTLAIVGFAWLRRPRLRLLSIADIAACCAPLGLMFGRIANFINGELWGRVTTVPWGMVFCGRNIPADAGGGCVAGYLPRHPSQLYEAALEGLVLFLVLRLASHRLGWLRRPGAITGLFLVGYASVRIALENVRMPDPGLRDLPYGLTVGMLLSIPMLIGGAWLIWRGRRGPAAQPPA